MKKIQDLVKIAAILLVAPMGFCSCNDNDVDSIEQPLPQNVNGKYAVVFNLNYDGVKETDTAFVTPGHMMQISERRQPKREGYLFAGWYTSKECKPEQEWLFGAKSGGYYPPVKLDSMAVKQSMRLYARWASPVSIKTAEQLSKIREDLNGWYVLDNDIDLSAIADWEPIGEYKDDYETADGEWWTKAFKGKLDGQGHTIKGLNLTTDKPSMKALFGAMANGTICNLVLENCHINLESPSTYVAPLVAVIKQDGERTALVQNCEVKDVQIKVGLKINQNIFSAVTGLIAGAWNGTIDNCHVGGNMTVNVEGSGKGELYIGGILGEGYSDTKYCSSTLNINTNIQTSGELKVFAGGLQASATNVDNSLSSGNIEINVGDGVTELYVGGLIGSQRYGSIKNSASQGNITVKAPKAQIGGVLGEFNKTYGSIGTAFGITQTALTNCYTSGIVTTDGIQSLTYGNISGAGQPEALQGWFGPGMSYLVANCAYLKQPISSAADADIKSLKGFDTIDGMKGDTMKNLLGTNQWIYESGALPTPKK